MNGGCFVYHSQQEEDSSSPSDRFFTFGCPKLIKFWRFPKSFYAFKLRIISKTVSAVFAFVPATHLPVWDALFVLTHPGGLFMISFYDCPSLCPGTATALRYSASRLTAPGRWWHPHARSEDETYTAEHVTTRFLCREDVWWEIVSPQICSFFHYIIKHHS